MPKERGNNFVSLIESTEPLRFPQNKCLRSLLKANKTKKIVITEYACNYWLHGEINFFLFDDIIQMAAVSCNIVETIFCSRLSPSRRTLCYVNATAKVSKM